MTPSVSDKKSAMMRYNQNTFNRNQPQETNLLYDQTASPVGRRSEDIGKEKAKRNDQGENPDVGDSCEVM